MIVLDASAAVDLLCRAEPQSSRIADRVKTEFAVNVPQVFDLEVLHALRGLERSDQLAEAIVGAALRGLTELRAVRHDHGRLRTRVWALRHNLTVYDAAYVALAELLEAPLLTTDGPLARTSGHAATIELLA